MSFNFRHPLTESCQPENDGAGVYSNPDNSDKNERDSDFIQDVNKINSQKHSTRTEIYRRLIIAKEHIESSFTEKISIKDLSYISSLSENHFLRHFKEAFGITPHQYIVIKRLKLAEHLLKRTDDPVALIVLKCGFDDPSSFGRLFKSRYMISPARFRSMNS